MLPEIDGFYSIGMCQIIWFFFVNIANIFRTAMVRTTGTSRAARYRGRPRTQGTPTTRWRWRHHRPDVPMMSSQLWLQDQVSSLIRNVRSSRIFDSSFDANRSFDSDFVPSTGMQKSCTASSIVDLGNDGDFRCDSLEIFGNRPGFLRKCVDTMYVSIINIYNISTRKP